MRATGARLVAASFGLTMVAGCASGPIHGRLTVAGQQPEPVTLNYRSSLFGKKGDLWATLPGGERFTGSYVLSPYDPDRQMLSTLTGDRGNSMVCRFLLNQPGVGPDGGGTAQCKLSTGGVIDARF